MNILNFIEGGLKKFKFLKWIQIIQDETKATNPTAMYLLEKDDNNFDIVVVDDAGNKRKNVSGGGGSLLKVDKTTTSINEPDAEFKYAYIFNDENETRRMLAGDLGKNIANSSLTSVSGAGMTLGAPYIWNAAGQFFSITGLPDKSADTTFNKLLIENNAGQVALSNGKTLLKSIPYLLDDAEKTTWKTEMNGGWTTNSMSVALINPVVVRGNDSVQYVNLIGANLNLNPVSFKVSIITVSGVVIADIPNSQVQIQPNGLSLVFYYNFMLIPIGVYKIKLWNGVAEYITPITFSVVDNVTSVDLSAITWENKNYLDLLNPSFIGSGSTVSLTANLKNQNNSDYDISSLGGNIISSALSSPIFTLNEDFVIELGVFNSGVIQDETYGGLTTEPINSLAQSILYGAKVYYTGSLPRFQNLLNNFDIINYNTSSGNKVIIYKLGNNISVVTTNSFGTSVSSAVITPSNMPLRLKLERATIYEPEKTHTSTLQIISAYKL